MDSTEIRLKCLELAKGDVTAATRMYEWVCGRADACKQAVNPQLAQARSVGISGLAGGLRQDGGAVGSYLPGV